MMQRWCQLYFDLSTLDNDVEMLSDADFTLMSTLDNHDVQTLSDADFTLILSTLVHSRASMAATLLLSKHKMFHGDSSSNSWFIWAMYTSWGTESSKNVTDKRNPPPFQTTANKKV